MNTKDMMRVIDGKSIEHSDISEQSMKGKLMAHDENISSRRSSSESVLRFIDHWSMSKGALRDGSSISMDEAKPSNLFHADNKLINIASSLSVSKIVKLEARRKAIQEITIDLDKEIKQEIDDAKSRVANSLRPYFLEKEKQEKKDLLIKIESSQIRFQSEKERMELLEQTKDSLREIAGQMRQARPQYTKALKSLAGFASLIIRKSKMVEDMEVKEAFLEDSICFLEEMMDPVETSWKGIPGRSEDLPRIKDESVSSVERAEQIRIHLNHKIEAIDAKQFKRLEQVATHPVFAEILRRHKEGTLPQDGSIFFFMDSGRPVLRIDACSNPRPRPGQSKDSAIKHAVKTPEFMDINRLDKGIGPDGAGLFRFAELTERIQGAVILAPVIQNGQEVKLPGMSKPKRQARELIGSTPDCITVDMSYGAILNKFRSKIEKLLADRNIR